MDKDQAWYSTFDEVLKNEDGKDSRTNRITRSMFPTETEKSHEDSSRIPLERCIRVYPHLQDTGSFFITVLEKKEEIRHIKPEEPREKQIAAPANVQPQQDAADDIQPEVVTLSASAEVLEPESKSTPPSPSPRKRKLDSPAPAPAIKKLKAESDEPTLIPNAASSNAAPSTIAADPTILTPAPEPTSTSTPKPFDFRGKTKKSGPPPEEPFKFLPHDHAVLERIYEFYGLSERFPRTCFMVRNAEALPVRAIYFTSHFAKRILEANEGRGVKFVHCGVKAFMKQDVQSPEVCPWRIQSEGLGIVAPWIGSERIVHATKKETVHALLKELFPKVGNTESDKITMETEGRKSIDEIEHQVREMGMGCCILKVKKTEGEFDEDMILPLWKSRHSCNLMLPKDERKYVLPPPVIGVLDWMLMCLG
jgi:multisite-specific tRNA:(cytosine-C5)-methyltransferase